MPNPYVLQGIMAGAERASQTLLNISLKKKGLERQKKSDDLDFKIKSLSLEKLQGQMESGVWDSANETLKSAHKVKKAAYDYGLKELKSEEATATRKSEELDTYAKGLSDGVTSQITEQRRGFELGGSQYDLSAALKGEFKETTPSQRLKREKATVELRKRAGARQPLDTKVLKPKSFLGFGGNEETVEFAKTIQTRQDLINMIKNADVLEERGIKIDQLEDLYEDELLALASEGYLSEKK